MAGVALLGCLVLALSVDIRPAHWPIAVVLLGVMIAAAIPTLSFVVRRQAVVVTLTEIPLVLALYRLPPLLVVLVATTAGVATQIHRGYAPPKFWFNVAHAAAGASVAGLVVAAASPLEGVGPATWGVLFAALMANSLISLVAVVGVISLLQGWQGTRETASMGVQVFLTTALNVAIGMLILIALVTTLWSTLLLLALTVAGVLLYRSYAQFLRQHRTLGDMYDLTRAMTEAGQEGNLADALLGRIRSLMQAEYATLWLPAQGRHPEVLLTARLDDRGLLDVAQTPAMLREHTRESGQTIALGRTLRGDPELRRALADSKVKDVISVPLRSGQAVIGTLEVVNRLSDLGHFAPGDIPIFETVAAHAAVALENSRLVDRLRHDAYHDALTKLPNRRRINGALAESVKIRAPGEVVALLLFDVDGLRQVNESLGHAAGDKVLAEVAARLRASAPSSALVGRAGGRRVPGDDAAGERRGGAGDRCPAARADP